MLTRLSAEFFEREASSASLITVTHTDVTPDLKKAVVYVSIFPDDKENAAIGFLKRHRSELRDYVKSKMSMKTIPFFEIEIDAGEKNRQKIDELLRQ